MARSRDDIPRQDNVTAMVRENWVYGVTISVPVMVNPWIAQ